MADNQVNMKLFLCFLVKKINEVLTQITGLLKLS